MQLDFQKKVNVAAFLNVHIYIKSYNTLCERVKRNVFVYHALSRMLKLHIKL
jgi:hypothetical protein